MCLAGPWLPASLAPCDDDDDDVDADSPILALPTSVMERPEFVRVITDMTSWVASLIKKVNRVSGGVS